MAPRTVGAVRDLLAVVGATPLVDHHVHAAFRAAPSRAAYGEALNEADTDPLPAAPTPSTARSASRSAPGAPRCSGSTVTRPPTTTGPAAPSSGRTRSTGASSPPPGSATGSSTPGTGRRPADADRAATAGGGRAHEVVRLESLAESVARPGPSRGRMPPPSGRCSPTGCVVPSRSSRCSPTAGLRRRPEPAERRPGRTPRRGMAQGGGTVGSVRLTDPRLIAFGIHEAIGLDLPLQLHVGLGDRDMDLRRSDPLLLTDFLRMPEVSSVPVMLLDCYPFERQAGYLAQAFRNVFLDVGLSVNFLGARAASLVARSLELAPFGQVLYSSDACGPRSCTSSEPACGATRSPGSSVASSPTTSGRRGREPGRADDRAATTPSAPTACPATGPGRVEGPVRGIRVRVSTRGIPRTGPSRRRLVRRCRSALRRSTGVGHWTACRPRRRRARARCAWR